MSIVPQYIQSQWVVDRLGDKMKFQLVQTIPAPDTVTVLNNGYTQLSWDNSFPEFPFLPTSSDGSLLLQSINAQGYYEGLSPNIFGILLSNVHGTFQTSNDSGSSMNFSKATNSVSYSVLNFTVCEAEALVTRFLSAYYLIPLQGSNGQTYNELPQDTNQFLNSMFIAKACFLLLGTEFARQNQGVGSFEYMDFYRIFYSECCKEVTGIFSGYLRNPPLLELAINLKKVNDFSTNLGPRKGYANVSAIRYAAQHMNNPSVSSNNALLTNGIYPLKWWG